MRLTGRGVGFVVAAVALCAAGLSFGYPDLVVLGCACGTAVAGGVAFVAWRPRLLVQRSVDPDRIARGEPSAATLTVANAGRFLGASVVARDRLGHTRSIPVPLHGLRPGRSTSVEYAVPTSRRGVVDIGPLEIARRDWLGLVGVVRQYGVSARVWVRPRVHAIAAVPTGLSRSLDGRADRVPRGGITIDALREYVMGDDLRHVHWRTSARVGELMVLEHVDTSLPRVVILLDDRASAYDPGEDGDAAFESACEAAASVLVAARREGVAADLALVTAAPAAGAARGPAGIDRFLDLLAEVSPAGAPEALRDAVERLRVRRTGDALLVLTGTPSREDLSAVAGLRGWYRTIVVAVFGPAPDPPADGAGVLVIGAEDGPSFAAAWNGVRGW